MLERQSDWNASTLPGHIWLDLEHALDSLGRRSKVPVLRARYPPLARVRKLNIHGIIGPDLLPFKVHMFDDKFVYVFGLHVWYCADGKFTNHLGGDDGLGSGGRESTFNAVNG